MRKENVIIYGIGKVQKDFEYIFRDINVEGYLLDDSRKDINIYNDKQVYSLSEVKFLNGKMIIICDFDKEEKFKRLEQAGLEYKKHFMVADDIFYELDVTLEQVAGQKHVYIWGTGFQAGRFLQESEYAGKVSACIDNDTEKRAQKFFEKPVLHTSDITSEQWKKIYVVITADAYYEIKKQLESYGLKEHENFIWYRYLVEKPSLYLSRTIYDRSKYNLVCDTMFNTYEIEATGEVCCCCTTFIKERIGNLIYQDFQDIWYSNMHKILCLSAANQTYTFCKKDMCPVLMEKKRYTYKNGEIDSRKYREIEKKPKVMLISIDSSCNLYCESCRDCVNILRGVELEKAELMSDKLMSDDNLEHTEFIVMAGNGEVFLSKIYERIWGSEKTKHTKRFRLLSNGTLFTRERWKKFAKARTSEVVATFSIDAATQETYQLLRRGGNFEQVLKNLEFASELRKSGQLVYFQISFVVQRKNFMEMPLFVELGKRLGVDKVFFTRILDWGTYSKDEFQKISMTDDDGRANEELQQILDMPIMRESIVDLGTINGKKDEREYDYIYNYYLWEIDRYLSNDNNRKENL